MSRRTSLASMAAAALLAAPLTAQAPRSPAPLDSAVLSAFRWRNIGPANMQGRTTSIVGIPSPSHTFFVAGAAGGIWKTTNGGTTFRPVFDDYPVISMGDLAIAPSDTMQVWAGTGEEDSRNSISPGQGVYKSTDGGLTWKPMGLEKTQQIGRIVVDPRDPNTVWVAALGAVWGSNPERGLYKTTDGGQTWKLVKFISDKAGFVDVALDPSNPDHVFASSWERVRGPYFLNSGGPGSGLWESTDGGAHWTEVKGGGFPTGMKGRIGIAIAPSDPKVVYALVEAGPSKKGGKNESGLYRSADAGKTWTKMNDRDTRPFYYSQVRVDPKDPNRVYWTSTPFDFSDDGGKTVRTGTIGVHVDDHAMWIDPNDPNHWLIGNDGGVAQTWDRGGNFDVLNVIPMGQFYEVSYDMAVPYNVCGGLQDNGAWCGPSRRADGPITNAMWFTITGGDGFYTAQDPTDPNIVYGESQGGRISRVDLTTGERTPLKIPSWEEHYRMLEDSILFQRGDTTRAVSPEQKKRIAALEAEQHADSLAMDYRFNWNTPYFLSPHDPKTLYIGGNVVFKSTNRGDSVTVISPDLSTKDTAKIHVSMVTTGGITTDATGAETYGTIVTLAESPIKAGLLLAGTDDGNVWITQDDGKNWTSLTGRFPGVPKETYVSRVEPSHFDVNTFYVAFDDHRVNDFKPYLYVTTDGGKTFRSLVNDLPASHNGDYVHVIREDPHNPDLLFVGTDLAAYVSTDRGGHWQRFMNGLPTVPVHDLKIHPRAHELIAATHGRAIWIVDIAALEQFAGKPLAAATFFTPPPAYEFGDRPVGGADDGQKVFAGVSEPYGAQLDYYLPSGGARAQAKLAILDAKGDTVQTMNGPGSAGLHHVYWNFRKRPEVKPLTLSELRDSVIIARRVDVLSDSLVKAGWNERAVERATAMWRSLGRGEMPDFGFGFGGGVTPGTFRERPAESPPPRAAGAGRQRAGGERAGGRENGQASREQMRDVARLIRSALPPGSSFARLGGFGRGREDVADAGDYTVALTAGGQTLVQKLHVERPNGGTGTASTQFEEEEP